jgi:non-canonical (house-cleaning) NTP pyrophosphatase
LTCAHKPGQFSNPSYWTGLEAGIRKEDVQVTIAQAPAAPDARNFSQTGNSAYFALPNQWMGFNHGMPFSEDGGWASG